MTFAEFLSECNEREGDSSNPPGHSYVEVLKSVRPDIAQQVEGTFLDPRFDATAVGEFLYFVQVAW